MLRTTTRVEVVVWRRLVFAAFLLLVARPGTSQFERLKGEPTNQASKRNNGSAPVLTGKVVLANIFVSSPRSAWSRRQRRDVRSRMESAVRFIGCQAARYDREVTFRQVEMTADYEKEVPTDLAADPAWTQQVITACAGDPANELTDRLQREEEADHVLLVLHVNKPGRSCNLTFSDGIDADYRAERIVCFTSYENRLPTAAATYVHEILHGFGAGELYFPYDTSDTRKKLAGRIFPGDVMYRVDYDLSRLEIGAYTAYRIGWCDTLRKEHRVFEDAN